MAFEMKANIRPKLASELGKAINSEPQVVYIMVEIRKLLEIDNVGKKYKTLKFFCDWALHSVLDRGSAIEIIKRFDEMHDAYINDRKEEHEQRMKSLSDLTSVEIFRSQLSAFLDEHQLPSQVVDEEHLWFEFVKQYSGVIEDVPLQFTPLPIKHVRSVTVKKVDADSYWKKGENADRVVSFGIQWRIETLSGKTPSIYHSSATTLPEGPSTDE